MAVKRRLIECECGEVFLDGQNKQLTGNLKYGPWRYKTSRPRSSKSSNGGDILAVLFERSVECAKCGAELVREKRQYELTPPINPNKSEPIPSYFERELVVASAPKKDAGGTGIVSMENFLEDKNESRILHSDEAV